VARKALPGVARSRGYPAVAADDRRRLRDHLGGVLLLCACRRPMSSMHRRQVRVCAVGPPRERCRQEVAAITQSVYSAADRVVFKPKGMLPQRRPTGNRQDAIAGIDSYPADAQSSACQLKTSACSTSSLRSP
jgi:hypothetical protein